MNQKYKGARQIFKKKWKFCKLKLLKVNSKFDTAERELLDHMEDQEKLESLSTDNMMAGN